LATALSNLNLFSYLFLLVWSTSFPWQFTNKRNDWQQFIVLQGMGSNVFFVTKKRTCLTSCFEALLLSAGTIASKSTELPALNPP
jgi:hypothetical protein